MDKIIIKKITAAVLTAGAIFTFSAAAAPGTDADPLISKSYIDSVVYPYIDSVAESDKAGLRIVDLYAGESLAAGAGTEIVLRSGSATVIASWRGGLCDGTGGTDLPNAAAVPSNHLLIVPRGDGRGVKATSDAILMVRGEFEIK
ncbi:MAG: hypothetical protein J1F63_00905 [Oscillospiraceae bacterium]|nr:hypothetical protein [Oscillospiraceae bacterium]